MLIKPKESKEALVRLSTSLMDRMNVELGQKIQIWLPGEKTTIRLFIKIGLAGSGKEFMMRIDSQQIKVILTIFVIKLRTCGQTEKLDWLIQTAKMRKLSPRKVLLPTFLISMNQLVASNVTLLPRRQNSPFIITILTRGVSAPCAINPKNVVRLMSDFLT